MARPPNVAIEPTNSKRPRTPVPTRSTTATCDIWIHVSLVMRGRMCNWAHVRAVSYETMLRGTLEKGLIALTITDDFYDPQRKKGPKPKPRAFRRSLDP